MTLKYLPSISSIWAQRRIRPSCCITSRIGCSTAWRIHSSRITARSDLERVAPGRAVALYCDLVSRACIEGISLAQSGAGKDIGEQENPAGESLPEDVGA